MREFISFFLMFLSFFVLHRASAQTQPKKKPLIERLVGVSLPNSEVRGPIFHQRTNTPKKSNAVVGRYLYTGDVPKFNANELEIYIAKMALTNRVKAWISQERIDQYATMLYNRWVKINNATLDQKFVLNPLISASEYASTQGTNNQAWLKVANQYMKHVLEDRGLDIYVANRKEKVDILEYPETISTAVLRSYFFDNTLTPSNILNDNQLRDNLLSVENSRALFQKHFSSIFTADTSKAGFLGFLTFVYPIAATTAGPFDQPKEQITNLKLDGSVKARWWSDKWGDEFGGFPFILIEWSGVAFHGPITNKSDMDVWFLQRGYVSHGCHRMDASDVEELKAMLPSDFAAKANQTTKVTVMSYYDVTDVNNDGKLEAIDVKYYKIPPAIAVAKGQTIDQAIVPYTVEVQKKSYFKNNPYGGKFYDEKRDLLVNIPKYDFSSGTVKTVGTHTEMPIHRMEYRPNRVIQYSEIGAAANLKGYNDNAGSYPPGFSN